MFENLGYHARPLPPAIKADLLTGRELADIGQCCPTSFTTGNLANYLNAEKERLGGRRSRSAMCTSPRGPAAPAASVSTTKVMKWRCAISVSKNVRMFLLSQNDLDQGAVSGGGLELKCR